MARTVSITSGKGGVGKTNISVNLALHLAGQGYRTCLFDADLGLANVDILLNLFPEYSLEDVISGEKDLNDILIEDCRGIDIVPGSSGVDKLADLGSEQLEMIIQAFKPLNAYDFILFDTSAGISKNVIAFCMASPEVLLVVTPEPTSLTDGYALLKVLSLNGFSGSIGVVVNQIKDVEESLAVFNKFKHVVKKYLPIEIMPAGTMVRDSAVRDAVGRQEPFVLSHPDSNASKCIRNISRYLLQEYTESMGAGADADFWSTCLDFMNGPMVLRPAKAPKNGPGSKKQQPGEIVKAESHEKPTTGSEKGRESTAVDVKQLLVNLERHMSSISSDMSAIRKLFEHRNG